MKREPFVSAAGAKWRRHRALGLLAAGLVPDVETGPRADQQFVHAITARLSRGDTGLIWRLDDPAARGSMVAALDRQRFETLVAGVPPWRRSLALRSSRAVDAVDAWSFFQTEEEAEALRKAGWTFWVSAQVPDLNLPTRPPFIIGHFAGTVSGEVAERLAEDEEFPSAFSVSALSRTTPHCDIQILCDRDVERAVEHAERASSAIGGSSCQLCIVMLKEGLPEHPRMRMFVRLRDALGAHGLIVGKGDATAALELTRTLIREFVEGNPLWQQSFATEAGPAMLLCDERMATHRLTSWTPESAEEARADPSGAPRGWCRATLAADGSRRRELARGCGTAGGRGSGARAGGAALPVPAGWIGHATRRAQRLGAPAHLPVEPRTATQPEGHRPARGPEGRGPRRHLRQEEGHAGAPEAVRTGFGPDRPVGPRVR